MNTILGILVILLIYVGYLKYICQENVVKIGNYGILVVMTESMQPEIKENELIVIKESKNYELNDIVTYMDSDENLVTHRIVHINQQSFMSKGDHNDIVDANTDLSKIEGKVIYHSEILGIFVLYYLKFVILICVVILLIIYVKEIVVKEKEDEVKKESVNHNH